jgi:chloramphenicol-sensitive protein RarD
LLLGLAAWVMWGFFPLYWPLLEPAGAVEILAHRIFWSMVVMLGLVVALRKGPSLRATFADRRTRWLLAVASVLITVNWGTYIWGVNHHHVVETSLGYFINPLVSVLLGVLLLGERLRTLQWVALGIAAVAVVALTVEYGHPPWVALILAFSFGSYGLFKKKADAGAVESLVVETVVISPVALAYIIFLMGTGAPLLCFGGAATRIPLSTLGLMQYLTPTVQFVLGLVVFHEPMPAMRWVGFGLIWVALALFTAETLRNRRRQLRPEPAEKIAA